MNFSLLESEILPPPLACELQHFLARLDGVRPSGAGYMARCPAHEDRNPSLSIQAGQDGRVLFNCHAGCDSNTVLARLELRWADLRPPTRDKKQIGERAVTAQEIAAWPSTRALYEYQDETGKSLFLVVRMQKAGKKTFAQYRSLGGQLWRKGLDGMQPRLYRSPDLAGARMRRERVFVVEGEKDVETLRGLGLVATCNPGGAGKWRVSFSEALQGLQVAVLPDNDEVGRKHALEVAQSLLGRAEGVKVLELPGLPSKGDVTDWVEQGGTRIELESLIESLPVWRNTRSQLAPASEAQLHLTELGNSQRLVKRWGAELRFCHPWQRWLVWNGCRWVTDSTGDAIRKAKETVRSIYSEAAQLTDDRQRQETVAHGRRSETQARLRRCWDVPSPSPAFLCCPIS